MSELTPRKIQGYGFRPSLPRFGEPAANIAGLKVKDEVDPRQALWTWVFNQLRLGSCTANATSMSFRYDASLDGKDPGPLSRLWIYRGERQLEGVLGQGDTGAMGHDAFTVASTLGVPPENDWPYDIATFEQDPPKAAVENAGYYKLTKSVAAVPQNQQAMKAVLSNDQIISFGFTVYDSFESPEVAKTGIVPIPRQGESILGGHEVDLVGYLKSEPQYGLCLNSWGSRQTDGNAWGLDGSGFFLMPWSFLTDSTLVTDLRTITRPIAD